jgi:hypothetical protein
MVVLHFFFTAYQETDLTAQQETEYSQLEEHDVGDFSSQPGRRTGVRPAIFALMISLNEMPVRFAI